MKYIKYIFSFLLTPSLSSITIYICITLSYLCQLKTNNVALAYINGLYTYSETCFVNINNDDDFQVFGQNDMIVHLSKSDIYLMSQIVYAESKGEPFQGKVAVASVILNRVLDPAFPDTIEDVIFQPYAFSCVIDGKIAVIPTEDCFEAVYESINGNDPTGEALFFYNPDISTCAWMQDIEKTNTTSIGQHIFFTL